MTSYERQWVAGELRRLGYTQAADEAIRVLPERVSAERLQQFCDRLAISRGELISRMGGSP